MKKAQSESEAVTATDGVCGGMKALSLTRPWDWCIVHDGKPIENRSRKDGRMPSICRHRGPLLLHAAKSLDRDVRDWCYKRKLPLPPPDGIATGAIVGRCDSIGHIEPFMCDRCDGCGWVEGGQTLQTGCAECGGRGVTPRFVVDLHEEEWLPIREALNLNWWMGGYALILANARPTKVVKCRGALGCWTVPDDVMKELAA